MLEYSLEELAYEYFDHEERNQYSEERKDEETDKIEEAKLEDALKWAEEEEAKEEAKLNSDTSETASLVSPEDSAWMEEQLQKERALYGDTFGQDISEEF